MAESSTFAAPLSTFTANFKYFCKIQTFLPLRMQINQLNPEGSMFSLTIIAESSTFAAPLSTFTANFKDFCKIQTFFTP